MQHKIIMIAQDGSTITSKNEVFDPSKPNYHDDYFLRDIYHTPWFQNKHLPFDENKKLVSQLADLSASGVITLLDLSYIDTKNQIHNGIQIAAPAKQQITKEQKQTLKNYYQMLSQEEFDQVFIECVKSLDPLETDDYYDINAFYEDTNIIQKEKTKKGPSI